MIVEMILIVEDKITINRLMLSKTKKTLATDIDWPVEELLR